MTAAIAERVDLELRPKVNALQAEMLKLPQQVTLEIAHHFAHGVYAREMVMPKHSLVVGKIHLFSQINILSKGEVSVLTERGIERFTAPHTFSAPSNTKRVIYAHEDSVWTCILGTHETDVAKIEAEFVVDTDEDYAAFLEHAVKEIELCPSSPLP